MKTPKYFKNFYECPKCGYHWEDEWDFICEDDCPSCGERHIKPYESEDLARWF